MPDHGPGGAMEAILDLGSVWETFMIEKKFNQPFNQKFDLQFFLEKY